MSRGRKGSGDYLVGKGRPPVETRFKPGRSGNPRGRPKTVKTVDAILREALHRKVALTEHGRPRTRTVQEVMIYNLTNAAARGDHKAVQLVIALQNQYRDSPENIVDPTSLPPEDEAILRDYIAGLAATQQHLNNANAQDQGGGPVDPEERGESDEGGGDPS